MPPSSSASFFDSGRPSPVPLTRRCSGCAICANSWKMQLDDRSAAMPMPVSRTREARPCRPGVAPWPQTRTSPRSVNLIALEMKLRRICDTLLSSVSSGGSRPGRRRPARRGRSTSSGRSMPRSAPNSDVALRTATARTIDLARLDLGEIEQIVDQLGQVLAPPVRMKRTCFSCSARELAVAARQQQARQRQDRVQRRAELVAHVGRKLRLHLVGAPQVVGPLVELGIQRDDAAVGVLQLAG